MRHIFPKTVPSPSTISTPSNAPIRPLTAPNGIRIQSAILPQYTIRTDWPTDRQTDRQTSHIARCVTFAVARIRVGNRRNFAYFSLWHRKYGRYGSKKAYTGPRTGIYLPTKFGCDRSIVVGCRSRNDRQTDRQTEWNDNKAHCLRCERDATHRQMGLATGLYQHPLTLYWLYIDAANNSTRLIAIVSCRRSWMR